MITDAELARRAKACLAAASVIAEARSSNPEPTTGGSKPESASPVGTGPSIFDTIATVLAKASTNGELRRAVYQSEAAIDRAKHSPRNPRELGHERDKRIIRDYAGLSAEEAAAWEGVSAENIRRTRRDHDRNPSTGRTREVEHIHWTTPHERARLAAVLAQQGQSVRAIARRLGVGVGTIHRDLGDAA